MITVEKMNGSPYYTVRENGVARLATINKQDAITLATKLQKDQPKPKREYDYLLTFYA